MLELKNFHPGFQSLIAGLFPWFCTALGSLSVLFMKKFNQKVFDWLLGFAGGIMVAASFWSLLLPAFKITKEGFSFPWFPPALGFFLGMLFFLFLDNLLPHLHLGFPLELSEGIKTSWKRTLLLFLAITLHKIPEGLAIGVLFGTFSLNIQEITLASVLALTLGMGIQSIPDGFAISTSFYREQISRFKSFFYGQLSGLVVPISAVLGFFLTFLAKTLLPYALGFAAGAMMFVVIEEVIPEAQKNESSNYSTVGFMFGFLLMMILDNLF